MKGSIVAVSLVLIILPSISYAAPNCNKTEIAEKDSNSTLTATQQLNNIIKEVQCSLEKTNWLSELEKEAKRLEENAKRIGLGFLNSVSSFVSTFTGPTNATSTDEKGETEDEEDEEEAEVPIEVTTLKLDEDNEIIKTDE